MKKNYVWGGVMAAFFALIFAMTFSNIPGIGTSIQSASDVHFSFADYEEKEIPEILKEKFPVGTTKDEVDRILVETGAASAYENALPTKDYRYIRYTEAPDVSKRVKTYGLTNVINPDGEPFYSFLYDKDGKLMNIYAPGGYLYKDQPKIEDLIK